MSVLFKIIYGFDALVALIILYFFFIGITDGTVSRFNALLWMATVAVVAFVMFGSVWFNAHNYTILSYATLLILAIPALLFLLYFLVAIWGGGRWN